MRDDKKTIFKLDSNIDNIYENIEDNRKVVFKMQLVYTSLLSIFLSIFLTFFNPELFNHFYQNIDFIVISTLLFILLICSMATILAYFIYVQLSYLKITVTQREDNLFYRIKKELQHACILLPLVLLLSILNNFLLTHFIPYYVLYTFICMIVSILLVFVYLCIIQGVINLILCMIKHAHTAVILISTKNKD